VEYFAADPSRLDIHFLVTRRLGETMKILGAAFGVVLIGAAYTTLGGVTWTGVIVAGVVGVVLSQAMHATGWREVLTVAGATCLVAAGIGAFLLLLQMFLG
jgi:hypothetical protein